MKSVNTLTDKIKRLSTPDTIRGNQVWRWWADSERYLVDFADDFTAEGWKQYDTNQDAHYFGVWVNPVTFQTLTYAEGDWDVVQCADEIAYKDELASMAKFYGDPPPTFVSIDMDNGQITNHYDIRPE